MRITPLLLLALALSGCAATSSKVEAPVVEAPTTPAKKTYAVHFGRPSHVGERARLVSDHREEMATKVTRDGAVVTDKHDKHTVHYDAVITVVAADSAGRGTRTRHEVKELTSDGHRLQAGLIELTRHAKKADAEILVDGSPASEEVRKALSSVLKLGLDGASDDDVFGTKALQPIGAHWSVDEALALAALREDGINASKVQGEVWLDGTTKVDGAECLDIRATLGMSGVQVPGMPEGAVTELGRAEAEMRAALPLEGRVGRSMNHVSTKMSFRVRVPAPEGAPMMVSVEGHETIDARETAM
jgi:hypothetical protein